MRNIVIGLIILVLVLGTCLFLQKETVTPEFNYKQIVDEYLSSHNVKDYTLIEDRNFEYWKKSHTFEQCIKLVPCDTSHDAIVSFFYKYNHTKYINNGNVILISKPTGKILGGVPSK